MAKITHIFQKKDGIGNFNATNSGSFSITAQKVNFQEGETVAITINTIGVPNGTYLDYEIVGATTAADWEDGTLADTIQILANKATIFKTIAQDQTIEVDENWTIQLKNPIDGVVLATFDGNILNQTPVLTRSLSSVNEGGTVTVTIDTVDVPDGTQMAYTVTGISAADLSAGNLTGFVTINSNTAQVSFTLAEDALAEGAETLTFTLNGLGTSIGIVINDTSTPPSGEATFTSFGTYSFIVPEGVNEISTVLVGGGGGGGGINTIDTAGVQGGSGGGGGGLRWLSGLPVTPGETLEVIVGGGGGGAFSGYAGWGGQTYLRRAGSTIVTAGGGLYGASFPTTSGGEGHRANGGTGTSRISPPAGAAAIGGGDGGDSGFVSTAGGGGGGGAGGYNGTGGWGGNGGSSGGNPAQSNSGGAGGGAGATTNAGSNVFIHDSSTNGGGVGLNGKGQNGNPGFWGTSTKGGSGGGDATNSAGGVFGGGGSGYPGGYTNRSTGRGNNGANGGAKIIWGPNRSYPTNVNG